MPAESVTLMCPKRRECVPQKLPGRADLRGAFAEFYGAFNYKSLNPLNIMALTNPIQQISVHSKNMY